MKKRLLSALIMCSFVFSASVFAKEKNTVDSSEALQKLIDGNNRYVHLKLKHPDQTFKRREELTKGQHPFAVVLTCSDSRVSPEIIFDEGLGDIFVIRVAGNVVDDNVMGSIEYAVEHLKTPLVVVMGHEKCGAVSAAVQNPKQEGHIQNLVDAVKPAVDKAKTEKGDLVDNAIRDNVKIQVENLKKSEPIIFEFVKENKVKVVGAYYHLDSGKVDFIK